MNLQALTYYCEQCGDHSLGDSCFLHPRRPEEEERNAAGGELKAHVVKELVRSEQEGRRELFHEFAKKQGAF